MKNICSAVIVIPETGEQLHLCDISNGVMFVVFVLGSFVYTTEN